MRNKRTIAVVGGYWSANIGNSFFQLGAKYILDQIFPEDKVIMVADQPAYWNTKIGNPANAFNILDHINPDYFVILGPFLQKHNKNIWYKTMKILKEKKIKVIVLGAGMMKYDKDEINISRSMLEENPPFIFSTRDRETFNLFSDLAHYSYDGIDPAFYVSEIYDPIEFDIGKYIALNFDLIPEPKILISSDKHESDYSFNFQNIWWEMKFSSLKRLLSKKIRGYAFIDALIPLQMQKDKIGKYKIIRTDHRANPIFLKKVYKAKNSFVSDIPYTYLNIYANAEVTFTNRVHACVASLSYGRPALLFSSTPRVRLLERVGAENITKIPENISQDRLKKEKEQLIDFLKKTIG